jgi:hypothetical protein
MFFLCLKKIDVNDVEKKLRKNINFALVVETNLVLLKKKILDY